MPQKGKQKLAQKKQSDTPNAKPAKDTLPTEADGSSQALPTDPEAPPAAKPPKKPKPPKEPKALSPDSESPLPPPPPLPIPVPTSSKPPKIQPVDRTYISHEEPPKEPSCWQKFRKYLYDREKGTYCERTCQSWLYIMAYSIMYLIFLTTYMLIFLYVSLSILKAGDFKSGDKIQMLTYSEFGIGLTATPTSEDSNPLIWYKNGQKEGYEKYIRSIDKLLLRRKTRDVERSLGQCGRSPYGYGSAPCVIVRINKQLKWTGKALSPNSSLALEAPKEVMQWVRSGKRMLWLYCGGYHSYDKEHIGRIKYYPHPPGYNPALFPLDVKDDPPLVAVQFSSFTEGVSLAIQCKLWHEHGPSSVDFVIYVEPRDKTNFNVSSV